MRQARWFAVLTLAGLFAQSAMAQPPRAAVRQDRRLARLLDQLRDNAWTYRQELNFFQRAPEYEQLVSLRYHLRNKAARVVEIEQAGQGDSPEQKQLAREMQQYSLDIYRMTRQLENRAEAGARDQVRLHADNMTELAVEIRVLVGRLHEALNIDYRVGRDGHGPGPEYGRPGGPPHLERPVGREIR